MIESFSTPDKRNKSFTCLVIAGFLAVVSIIIGIDDNPPGAILAIFAAITCVLAFAHPWRTTKKFAILFLASVLGILLFIVVNITTDTIIQAPTTSEMIRNLLENPVYDALTVIFAMLCIATFLVGAIGSVVMFFLNRFQTKP